MGLRKLIVVFSLLLSGCAAKTVVRETNKHYLACCDPGLNAADKDMCKWLTEKGISRLYRGGEIYEGVWDGCKQGEEPWRKWESLKKN